MAQGIRDKVVLLTGAAQGIGAMYARHLAAEGAKLVVTDVNEAGVQALAEAIGRAGGTARALKVDIASQDDTERMARFALEQFGRIDGLVNNAALFSALLPKRSMMEIDVAQWDRVMAVNVRGPFLCCRAVLPQMRQQKSGSIVTISSNTVLSGVSGFLHYVTSKSALVGFTRALAREIGPDGIRTNLVMPGLVDTDGVRQGYSEEDRARAQAVRALARPQTPEDLNGVIAFLLSEDSAFITGQTFNVDGGALFH